MVTENSICKCALPLIKQTLD